MIQRKQTLFLLQLVLLSIVLMFVPCARVTAAGETGDVFLLPVNNIHYHSSAGHWAAIGFNFLNLVLSFVAVFLYNHRPVQKKLCWVVCAIWAIVTLMLAFCPFIESADAPAEVTVNYYAVIIGILGTMGAVLAARFIQRDIDLIKSADRIR